MLVIKGLKLPNFFFDIRLSMYEQNASVKILLKTGLVGKDLLDRGKIIQVFDFGYNNNAIRNQKHFQPISFPIFISTLTDIGQINWIFL